MGLDNGIIVKGVTRKDLPRFMRYPFDEDYTKDEVDICYWRKCFGLRDTILYTIASTTNPDKWQFTLTIKDVDFIRSVIVSYLKHPETWDNSIWDYDEIYHSLLDQRWNLILLHFWMKRHPDKEVVFYDSY